MITLSIQRSSRFCSNLIHSKLKSKQNELLHNSNTLLHTSVMSANHYAHRVYCSQCISYAMTEHLLHLCSSKYFQPNGLPFNGMTLHHYHALSKSNVCYNTLAIRSGVHASLQKCSGQFEKWPQQQPLLLRHVNFHTCHKDDCAGGGANITDLPDYLVGSITEVDCPENEDQLEEVENELEDEIIEFLTHRSISYDEMDCSFTVNCPTCTSTNVNKQSRDIFVDKHSGTSLCYLLVIILNNDVNYFGITIYFQTLV